MHIPWGWIKQRPHFLAEALSTDFHIDILCKSPWKVRKSSLINKNENDLHIKSFIQFPFDKISLLRNVSLLNIINKIFLRFSISKKKFNSYDYIWITSISIYPMISHLINDKSVIIWDCMDDELEFGPIKNNIFLLDKYRELESTLIKRADIIFCSSEYLSKKIQRRTEVSRDIKIVNNAIQLPTIEGETNNVDLQTLNNLEYISEFPNIFMYIGAISEWFNFDILINVLDKEPNMYIVLIGPNDVPIKKHERIIHLGVVNRRWIFHFMEKSTALIMPFKINELIRSVNPVKIYEYIYANRPVIAPYYEEIEKFSNYIHTYNSQDDFLLITKKIIAGELSTLKSEMDNKEFAYNNQWKNRYIEIKKVIS